MTSRSKTSNLKLTHFGNFENARRKRIYFLNFRQVFLQYNGMSRTNIPLAWRNRMQKGLLIFSHSKSASVGKKKLNSFEIFLKSVLLNRCSAAHNCADISYNLQHDSDKCTTVKLHSKIRTMMESVIKLFSWFWAY